MNNIKKIIFTFFILLFVISFVLLNNTQLSEQVIQANKENSSSEIQTGSIGNSESISSSASSSQSIPSSSSSENTSTDETQTPPSSEEQSSVAPPSSQEQSSEAPPSSSQEQSSEAPPLSAGQGSESPSKPEQVLPPPVQQKPLPSIGKYMVGYYTSWSASKGYHPSNIDAEKLTHINYAFAGISDDNKILLNNTK